MGWFWPRLDLWSGFSSVSSGAVCYVGHSFAVFEASVLNFNTNPLIAMKISVVLFGFSSQPVRAGADQHPRPLQNHSISECLFVFVVLSNLVQRGINEFICNMSTSRLNWTLNIRSGPAVNV